MKNAEDKVLFKDREFLTLLSESEATEDASIAGVVCVRFGSEGEWCDLDASLKIRDSRACARFDFSVDSCRSGYEVRKELAQRCAKARRMLAFMARYVCSLHEAAKEVEEWLQVKGQGQNGQIEMFDD